MADGTVLAGAVQRHRRGAGGRVGSGVRWRASGVGRIGNVRHVPDAAAAAAAAALKPLRRVAVLALLVGGDWRRGETRFFRVVGSSISPFVGRVVLVL